MSELEVTQVGTQESKKLCQTMSKSRKGGRYTKDQLANRRQEVYRLHFDYGYSARKIAGLMKINRNTINHDIDYIYSKIAKINPLKNPEFRIAAKLQRLEIQRTRLRELLDKTSDFEKKLNVERMLYDIDCKLIYIYQRSAESTKRVYDKAVYSMNKWLEGKGVKEYYYSCGTFLCVSEDAKGKIEKILDEDTKRREYYTH